MGSCGRSGSGSIECSIASLASGATKTIKLTVRRDSGTSFENSVRVYSDVDLNDENDSDFAIVDADPAAAADVWAPDRRTVIASRGVELRLHDHRDESRTRNLEADPCTRRSRGSRSP